MRADLRNVIHFPKERYALLQGSSGLDLAVSLRGLQAVNASTLPQHAFPCCVRGGECCPVDRKGAVHSCCSHGLVHKWMNRAVRGGGADLQWFTRTTWYDQHFHVFQRAKALLHHQHEEWAGRSISGVGFSYNTPPGPRRPRPSFARNMSSSERAHMLKLLKEWKQNRDRDARERDARRRRSRRRR